jgi:outer membrane protein insertion porin family
MNHDDTYDREGSDEILMSYGLEWRWKSPLGDLRFAYGIPISKVDGDEQDPRFEFAMGQAF